MLVSGAEHTLSLLERSLRAGKTVKPDQDAKFNAQAQHALFLETEAHALGLLCDAPTDDPSSREKLLGIVSSATALAHADRSVVRAFAVSVLERTFASAPLWLFAARGEQSVNALLGIFKSDEAEAIIIGALRALERYLVRAGMFPESRRDVATRDWPRIVAGTLQRAVKPRGVLLWQEIGPLSALLAFACGIAPSGTAVPATGHPVPDGFAAGAAQRWFSIATRAYLLQTPQVLENAAFCIARASSVPACVLQTVRSLHDWLDDADLAMRHPSRSFFGPGGAHAQVAPLPLAPALNEPLSTHDPLDSCAAWDRLAVLSELLCALPSTPGTSTAPQVPGLVVIALAERFAAAAAAARVPSGAARLEDLHHGVTPPRRVETAYTADASRAAAPALRRVGSQIAATLAVATGAQAALLAARIAPLIDLRSPLVPDAIRAVGRPLVRALAAWDQLLCMLEQSTADEDAAKRHLNDTVVSRAAKLRRGRRGRIAITALHSTSATDGARSSTLGGVTDPSTMEQIQAAKIVLAILEADASSIPSQERLRIEAWACAVLLNEDRQDLQEILAAADVLAASVLRAHGSTGSAFLPRAAVAFRTRLRDRRTQAAAAAQRGAAVCEAVARARGIPLLRNSDRFIDAPETQSKEIPTMETMPNVSDLPAASSAPKESSRSEEPGEVATSERDRTAPPSSSASAARVSEQETASFPAPAQQAPVAPEVPETDTNEADDHTAKEPEAVGAVAPRVLSEGAGAAGVAPPAVTATVPAALVQPPAPRGTVPDLSRPPKNDDDDDDDDDDDMMPSAEFL